MKFSYGVKLPLGRQYEQHSFQMELDDAEFPELIDRSTEERARFLQGELLRLALIFQLTVGYLVIDAPEFTEPWKRAQELRTLSVKLRSS